MMNEMRMIKRMFPVACCLGCMLLAWGSCSEGAEGETRPGLPAVGEVPLQVSVSMEGEPVDTRAAVPLEPDGGVIHVIRSNANGYAPAERTYQYTANESGSGSWAMQGDELPIYIDSRRAQLRAYYDPNGLIDNTGTKATLKAQLYDDRQLMYYCTSAANTPINCFKPNAKFNMKLPYARLKLTLKRDDENYLAGDCNITAIALSYKSGSTSTFYTGRNLDVTTGSLTTTVTAAAYTQEVVIGPLAPGETNADTYDVLLPPQSVGSGLTITLTIDGIKRAITLPTSQMSSFVAGSQYTVSLLILDTFYVTMIGYVWVEGFTSGTDLSVNGETID